MKKKVILFSNGWSSDNLYPILNSMMNCFEDNSVDIFNFSANNVYSQSEEQVRSEISIYDFPVLENYDAVIVFTPSLNSSEAREKIYSRCEKAGIPTIVIGDTHPGFYSIVIDNVSGTQQMCNFLFNERKVKKVKFIAGSKDSDDSNTRLAVVKANMERLGLPFSEEKDVLFSNWEVRATLEYLNSFSLNKDYVPDAVICANDTLALSSIIALEMNGINVPGDTIVTGFDNIDTASTYIPSIATVSQHYDLVGKRAGEILNSIFRHEDIPFDYLSPTEFLEGESCGVYESRNETELRRQFIKNSMSFAFESSYTTGRIKSIETTFLKADSYSQLPDLFSKLFDDTYQTEGDTYELILDKNLDLMATKLPSEVPKYKMPEEMQVIIAKYGNKVINEPVFPYKNPVVGYIEDCTNHIYFIQPLYLDTFVCGYLVTRDKLESLKSRLFPHMQMSLIQTLSIYRTNLKMYALNSKLAELMQTDPLTSLKNRIAYENAKMNLSARYIAGDIQPFAVAMFDVNNLKEVNDLLGHEKGDLYIRYASSLICNTFKHSPVFRIGGDEFVAIVSNSDYDQRFELLKQFRESVAIVASGELPEKEKVSVASGMADFDKFTKDDFDAIFRIADEEMYKNKKEMKAAAKERQNHQ